MISMQAFPQRGNGTGEIGAFLATLEQAREGLRSQPGGARENNLRQALDTLQARVLRKPRVVFLGEINAGKSALANAMLGYALLPQSVVQTTRIPIALRFADTICATMIVEGGRRLPLEVTPARPTGGPPVKALEIGLPAKALADFDILDTPGIGDYRSLAATGLTGSDIPIWCTVAGQAWKDSERRVWEALPRRSWRNAILAVTNVDLIADRSDLELIAGRLKSQAGRLFRDVVFTGRPAQDGNGFDRRWIGIEALGQAIGEIVQTKVARRARVGRRLASRILRGSEATPKPAIAAVE